MHGRMRERMKETGPPFFLYYGQSHLDLFKGAEKKMLQLYLALHLKVHLHTEVYTGSIVDAEINNWLAGNMLWYIQEYFKEKRLELFYLFS